MRHQIVKIAGLALVAPLVGATFFTSAPAAAAPTTVKTAAVKADDPFSVFKTSVRYPKVVRIGKKVTYKIAVINTGPHAADYYWLGGTLPKGVKKIWFGAIKGTVCDSFGREFWCWGPSVLDVDDVDYLNITVQFKKGYKGTVAAKLGALVWDVPTGAENLDKERLKELGMKSWFYGKTVKTKIIR